jgi:hypothetical protein
MSKWKRIGKRAHKPWDHGIPGDCSTGTNNPTHKVRLPVLVSFQQRHSMTVGPLFSSFILAQLPIHKTLAMLQHRSDTGVHSEICVDPLAVLHFVRQDIVYIRWDLHCCKFWATSPVLNDSINTLTL